MNSLKILLVDDNPGDVLLARKMLSKSTVPCSLELAGDGGAALERLASGPAPDLIILDLNMPRMDGLEFLRRMKSDPRLLSIPVLVMSSSRAADDVLGCYERHANSYVSKPADASGYSAVMRAIEEFWFRTARLPSA